ncbi:MAG: N-acetylmuramoyl-L-alanine amidase [Balneolaceae bacterium]|nr:MAG: N-acetylmuramoyl-L-alanine amidase [Balneolaceae bacterium]
MERIPILAILLITLLHLAWMPANLSAQTNLERISLVERSDGNGFVMRFHLTEAADSFKVSQPEAGLIQMMIYSPTLKADNFLEPERFANIRNVEYHKNLFGFGIDIFLEESAYLKANAYPDANRRHLLLNLEWSNSAEISRVAASHDFIYWHNYLDDLTVIDYEFFDGSSDELVRLRNGYEFNVIVIDAGHGGHDPGAINRSLGLRESDIALAVALKVGSYIEQYMPDVEVIYTRTDDTFVPLDERGLIATRAKGDLFVSIHANSAANPQAHGTEIFFLGMARSQSALEVMKRENSVVDLENGGGPIELSDQELLIYEMANAGNIAISERIASMIDDQFRTRAQRRSRGVKQAGLMALWHASTPGVLIELGFLSNPTEARYMASEYGQTILASAIFRAIRDFKDEYDRSIRRENRASNE